MMIGVEVNRARDRAENLEREVGKVARGLVANPANPAASPVRGLRENQASLAARARQERAENQMQAEDGIVNVAPLRRVLCGHGV
jgi:hypothetical protein